MTWNVDILNRYEKISGIYRMIGLIVIAFATTAYFIVAKNPVERCVSGYAELRTDHHNDNIFDKIIHLGHD